MEIEEEFLPLEAPPCYCYCPGDAWVADPDGSVRCLTEGDRVTIPMFHLLHDARRAIEGKFRELKVQYLRVVIGGHEGLRLTGFIGTKGQ